MSGFEVIGVVLGVYPIVLNACQLYRAARSGDGIEKLIRRLDIERFLFEDFVSRLLGPDVEESQLLRLKTSRDLSCWKENDLQTKLEQRHGFVKTKHIIAVITDLNDLLRSIQRDLPGVARSFEKQQSKFRFTFRNLKNNLSDPTASTQLSQLKEYNQTLRLLLTDHTTPSSDGSFRQPLPSLEFPQRDHSDARHVYSAICNGYKCDCHLPHYANIEVPQLNNTPSLAWPQARKEVPRLHILFPIEDRTLEEALSKVSLQEPKHADPPPPYPKSALRLSKSDMSSSTINTLSSKTSRKSRAISIRECADDSTDTIPDLCNFVKTFNGAASPGVADNDLGTLRSEKKKYKLHCPGSQTPETRDTVTLDEFTMSEKSTLPRGDRISLAVRLTYAIIQYYSTGWIDSAWTWKDFSVSGNDYKYSDFSQLFVSQKFYSAAGQTAKPPTWAGWESIGEPRLTRLGFALIELALGKRLSEMRDATIDPNMDPDAQDYWTAIRLLNTGRIMREEGEGYENVVRACIEHQFRDPHYTMRYLDSRDESFHKDVEQCVLKPLHCMWKEPWGRSQRQLCF